MTGFWKFALEFSQFQKSIDKVYWVSLALVTLLRNYNLFYFASSLSLTCTGGRPQIIRKMSDFRGGKKFMLYSMLKLYRWKLLSSLDTGHVFHKLEALIFCKFYSGFPYVGETPRIIDKMTMFWRLIFSSINWLLATLWVL